jgi:predicted nucleic acid-binding protein
MLDNEKKKLNIYLDNCCFNRPYDDQTQLRVELETKAKLFIQALIEEDKVDLTISYISDLENEVNPYQDRKSGIEDFFRHAKYDIDESDEILATAAEIEGKGAKPKDALHVSCAIHSGCEYFITTDDKLRKCKEDRIMLMSPMLFIEIWRDKENDE